MPYTEAQREWQEVRRALCRIQPRARQGTSPGLKTNERESILMSLPPRVRCTYNKQVEEGSEEQQLIEVLKNPKSWVS